MPKGKKEPRSTAQQERAGKSKARGTGPLHRSPQPESRAVLHELRVHQIELELQNEELRGARGAMEAALDRYTELFDFAPIGYATIGAEHDICEINHAGAQLLGRERARLSGQRFEQLVRPSQRSVFVELIRAAEISGDTQSCELDLLRGAAEPLSVRLSATTLRRTQPTTLLSLENVSESKQREQRLQLAERALHDAERRKDEFLATLSHELRNPLAPIRNSLFVLSRAASGSETAQRAQLIIDRQVTHLIRLIDDLQDATRGADGEIQLQLEHVELGALLRGVLEDHRTRFEGIGVELQGQIDPRPTWVKADPGRLIQVVSGLLSHALNHSVRGGRVVVHSRLQAGAVELQVVDTCAGVRHAVRQHFFEPFAQAAQTVDRTRGGLGPGLDRVRRLVELHGGRVSVHNGGPGTSGEMRISLPLAAAPEQAVPEPAPLSRRTHRVLVIEDNIDAADSLQLALTLNGHAVKVAPDGPRGLELAAQFVPSILLCDIGLPGMDGYSVARAVCAQQALRGTFLVALTGHTQPEDLQRAREAGFHRHLAKPTSLEALEQLLSEAPDPLASAGDQPTPDS